MKVPDEYKDKTFRAKADSWFDEGTESFIVSMIGDNAALMKGWKSKQHIWEDDHLRLSTGWDEEPCSLDEFDIIDVPSDYELIENDREVSPLISYSKHTVVDKITQEEVKEKII